MSKQSRLILGFLGCLLMFACKHQAEDYAIKGLDISHYQKDIDWQQLLIDTTVDFVFMKATEGVEYKDSFFQHNWSALSGQRIKRGAYHFFRPSLSVEQQIHNFIETVQLLPGDLPPVLDVEVIDNMSSFDLVQGVKTWLLFIESHYGVKPILYSSMDFYNQYLQGEISGYPLWIARYNSICPNTSSWRFWQYSNRGNVKGIPKEVDLNVFSGTWEELEKLCIPPQTISSDSIL